MCLPCCGRELFRRLNLPHMEICGSGLDFDVRSPPGLVASAPSPSTLIVLFAPTTFSRIFKRNFLSNPFVMIVIIHVTWQYHCCC